jgi:Predicted membrane-associated, metal-dependent hydrolase
MKDYKFFSKGFKYNSHRIINQNCEDNNDKKREIYVLILGETGRAANWSLYGYNRKTTPHIDTTSNIIKFSDVFTQSNTTHKIVSMLLTPADAERYNYIYYTKSIISAFSEAGFKTIYLTNQEYNQTFMQYYFDEADISLSVRHKGNNIDDQTMIPYIKRIIKKESKENLFIFIHLYGSHFKYQQRYGKEFAHYKPDMVENISVKSKEKLINSYDNSILNTDDFIHKIIQSINNNNSTSALLYLSDHGEDLMDDKRNRFLHASPVPTYYQLHIPFVIWFSEQYIKNNPQKYQNTIKHKDYPISSNTVFHTMLDMASISTGYLDSTLSVCSNNLEITPRVYLNDHDQAIPINKLNLTRYDYEQIYKRGLYFKR